eukprot:CAMPEP_0170576068 /NCGR_PEP_ID=MMETSP0224-20130122/4195_1 /TAXON_ID=285029 /ORGANISM="Togula jolla, Strain CCCM 725" /LENGTH=139 /DNA_ID=CAMNT_0010898885 /DNA_START=64 /DNA_END=483 /DNA_ORIENTATION=-
MMHVQPCLIGILPTLQRHWHVWNVVVPEAYAPDLAGPCQLETEPCFVAFFDWKGVPEVQVCAHHPMVECIGRMESLPVTAVECSCISPQRLFAGIVLEKGKLVDHPAAKVLAAGHAPLPRSCWVDWPKWWQLLIGAQTA